MAQEQDDESTIIIDFKSLNDSSLKKKKDDIEDELPSSSELEFLIPEDDDEELIALTQSNILNDINCPLYYLEFKTDFFKKIELSKNFESAIPIESIQNLNKAMLKKEPCILILYYNSSPKLANQITFQVKSKFPETKTIIMAKNLSEEKAKLHAQSKYSANEYISYPFQTEELENKIKKLKQSMIPE